MSVPVSMMAAHTRPRSGSTRARTSSVQACPPSWVSSVMLLDQVNRVGVGPGTAMGLVDVTSGEFLDNDK